MNLKFPPQIYINWEVDRICLLRPQDFREYDVYGTPEMDRHEHFKQKCLKMKLRYLAVNAVVQDPELFLDEVVPLHGSLEELVVFYDEDGKI